MSGGPDTVTIVLRYKDGADMVVDADVKRSAKEDTKYCEGVAT